MTTDDPGTVSTAVSTTSNNYLHVTIDDDDHDNSLNAPNNVVGDDGTGWTLAVATPGVINTNQICLDIALPVELAYFVAESVNEGVSLQWRTESEIENLGFILERKTTGLDWQEWLFPYYRNLAFRSYSQQKNHSRRSMADALPSSRHGRTRGTVRERPRSERGPPQGGCDARRAPPQGGHCRPR